MMQNLVGMVFSAKFGTALYFITPIFAAKMTR